MKTAIIIGISGQDSAYLCKLLLEKGYKVIGITRNLLNPNFLNLNYLGIESDIEMIEISKSGPEIIEKILKKYTPDEVYNLGAQSSVGYSFIDPINTVNYNI